MKHQVEVRSFDSTPNSMTNQCLHCQKSTKGKYCSNKCQHAYQSSLIVRDWYEGKIDGSEGTEWRLHRTIRRHLIEKAGNACTECGWSKVHPVTGLVPLEIDHLDGNCCNNRPENVKVLCPNCHSLTPNYGSLNRGKGNKDRLKQCKVGRKK